MKPVGDFLPNTLSVSCINDGGGDRVSRPITEGEILLVRGLGACPRTILKTSF